MDNLFLFIFMVVIFLAYVPTVLFLYGIIPSISDSYYHLPKKYNILFTIFCWGFAIPAISLGVNLSDNYLMFFAGLGIVFVGGAVQFKHKITREYHMIGAYGGVLFSQLSIAYDFKMYYVNIIFFILAILLQLLKKYINNTQVLWQEIIAFLTICYVLGKNII